MTSYCAIAAGHPLHGPYHDAEYGVHQREETVLFERLVLEIMQAGLSWELILRRRPGMRNAFASYDVDRIAGFGEVEIGQLLSDPAIIRNRRKVEAIIGNARVVQSLRLSHGGFDGWLDAHHPRPAADWVKLFRKTFAFTGPEVVGSFLISLGYLPGAHAPDCPVGARITDAPWQTVVS